MADILISAAGETVIYLISGLVGKTVNPKTKDIHRISELILLLLLAIILAIITFAYS